ncbi:MAG: ClbS/DfsB family four-helix bundle protein [Bacteroidetes bacterium]|nr:ClbS/DfsB family four-helix bundle protein [Bacteroidota bacterium]
MPRPASKIELESQASQKFEDLFELIGNQTLEIQEREFPGNSLNRSVRDVICHLRHWQLLFLDWYETGMHGGKPVMPAAGYSWKETPELNRRIQSIYTTTELNEAKRLFFASHQSMMRIIEKHSDEELFTKRIYAWTGTSTLGSYLVSATSSHYDWAIKFIKKQWKAQGLKTF